MPKSKKSSRRGSSRRSRTSRAELTFSVSLVEYHLRKTSRATRLSETAPIFLTTILEFLIRRLLELAGNEARRRGPQKLITPELLDLVVYKNTHLSQLFQFITISQVAPSHR
ncbi:histone H2A-Bbd type 2/3-like [Sigmodon hispidus]